MKIKFVIDWRGYSSGRIVEVERTGLGKGQIELLLGRGVVVPVAEEPVHADMVRDQPTQMTRRSRPGKSVR